MNHKPLFLFDYFAYDLFLCYDCIGPSLSLDTYPNFTVVVAIFHGSIEINYTMNTTRAEKTKIYVKKLGGGSTFKEIADIISFYLTI